MDRTIPPTTSKHCPECDAQKSCAWRTGRHVYVIELTPTVLEAKDYCRDARDQVTAETRFFYVGQTKHRVACRYAQHRARKARRARPGSTFDCFCKTGTCIKTPFHFSNRGNKFVRRYALKSGAVRPEFFFDHNPVHGGQEAARDMEHHVAQELRDLGHLVHCDRRK